MLKIAGCLLIISAGSFAGISLARNYARRPGELRNMITALQMLETEISYTATPLPEALTRMAACCSAVIISPFNCSLARRRCLHWSSPLEMPRTVPKLRKTAKSEGKVLDEAKVDELMQNYYQARGWNRETGRPLKETLEDLGLSDPLA